MHLAIIWLLLVLTTSAWAVTPADCPTLPTAPGDTMSLDVMPRIAPRPGMPQGGYVGFSMDHVPVYGTVCAPAKPALPRDVLHGDSSTDPLTGQPRGEVFIEVR